LIWEIFNEHLSLSSNWRDIQNIVATDEQVSEFIKDLGATTLLTLFEHHIEATVKANEGSSILCAVVEFNHNCVALDKL